MILDIQLTDQSETFDVDMTEKPQMFNSSFGEVITVGDPSQTPVNLKAAKIGWVTLLASAWISEGNLHHQVVNIDGVTENSQVDLTPSVQDLLIFYEKDLSFVTENDNGTVTVYAIGQKPANDYTIQVTITEVDI